MPDDQTINSLNLLFNLQSSNSGKKLRYRWQSALPPQEIGDFLFLPLTSSKELASEGCAMRHCVARYDELCAMGVYRVFSVRDLDGRRLATLGLIYGASGWKVDQCLGRKNAEVTTEMLLMFCADDGCRDVEEPNDLHYAALEMARLYAKAENLQEE